MEANKVRKMKRRICLVLDCLCAHDFSDKTADLINLQHYVIKEKRLSEREAIVIFYDVVRVVEALHKVSCQLVLKSMWNQNCLFYLTTFLMALARSGVCYLLWFPMIKLSAAIFPLWIFSFIWMFVILQKLNGCTLHFIFMVWFTLN